MNVYCCWIRYRLSPETFGYTLVYDHLFLTSALGGGEWLASRPWRFNPGVRAAGTDEQWVGSRACLDVVAKRKYLYPCPCRESNPGRPARSLVSICFKCLSFYLLFKDDIQLDRTYHFYYPWCLCTRELYPWRAQPCLQNVVTAAVCLTSTAVENKTR